MKDKTGDVQCKIWFFRDGVWRMEDQCHTPHWFASLVNIIPAHRFAHSSELYINCVSSRNICALARSGKDENVCVRQTQAYCEYRCCSFIKISIILLHNNAFKSQQRCHPQALRALPPSSRSSRPVPPPRGQKKRSLCHCHPLEHR